jgi:hypothetical protein
VKIFNKTSKKIKIKKVYNSNMLTAFAAVFAVIGLVALLSSFAAPALNGKSAEGESGTSALNTAVVADATASGGSYLELRSSTTSTPPSSDLFPIIPTDPALLTKWRVPTDPPSAANTSDEGAFRLICLPSHNLYDDPIIYPGQPGAAHLHTFFGNTLANANSTWNSLRTTGEGTCQSGPLNRSSYWAPALLNGSGKVIMPDIAVVYYKGEPDTVNLPRGLRYIAGYDATNPNQIYGNVNSGVPGGSEFHPSWKCLTVSGSTVNIPTNCPAGTQVAFSVVFPWCWNGQLDSSNHRDHVVYPKRLPGSESTLTCPTSHPTQLPRYTLSLWYSVVAGDNMNNWSLSSDMGMTPGTSAHADWFGAWDQGVLETWSQKCIREMRSCSASVYGDGTIGQQPTPWYWVTPNRLVDIPSR